MFPLIKEKVLKELELHSVQFVESKNTLHVIVNSDSVFIIRKLKNNSIKIHAHTRAKPAFSMVMLLACARASKKFVIGSDFDFDENNEIVPITYFETYDPMKVN